MAIIYQYPLVDVNTSDFFLVSKRNNGNKTANVRISDVINTIPTVLDLDDFPLYDKPFGNPGAIPQPGDTISYNGTDWVPGPPGTAKVEIITVTATTVGSNYEGSASGIGTLDQDVVYKTTFDATNTVSPVTLNINSYGAYDIQRGGLTGLEDIPVDFITAGVEYFLTWNGNIFQLHSSNPSSGASSEYVNPDAVTETIGGISVGTTFPVKSDGSGYTMQEMWDKLLYPYQFPTLSGLNITAQGPTVEVGYTIPASSYTFNWSKSNAGNIQSNSGVINDITDPTNNPLATGIDIKTLNSTSVTLPSSIQKTTGGATHKWEILGTNNQGGAISPSIYTITWLWRRYVGNNALTAIGQGDIKALSVNNSLASSLSGSYVFPGGGYKYLCIPVSFPEPSSIVSAGFPVAMAGPAEGYSDGTGTYNYQTVSVQNTFLQTINYRVYRSLNQLNGSATFIVS